MSNLIPERRTDKNGVTSTRWIRPDSSQDKIASSFPVPVLAPVNSRDDNIKVIMELLRGQFVNYGNIEKLLATTTDKELEILAAAIKEHHEDKDFPLSIAMSISTARNIDNVVNYALVYDGELHKDIAYRVDRHRKIMEAMWEAADALHNNVEGKEGAWVLAYQDNKSVLKAKRFVAAWCAMASVENNNFDPDILNQVTDDSRDDYDRIITIIRDNPTVTYSQLNYILSGGQPSISSGIL